MAKYNQTAHKPCAELRHKYRSDMNIRMPTSQWFLGVLGKMFTDKLADAVMRVLQHTTENIQALKCQYHILAINNHTYHRHSYHVIYRRK